MRHLGRGSASLVLGLLVLLLGGGAALAALDGDESAVQAAIDRLRDDDGTQQFVVYVSSFDGLRGSDWAAQSADVSQLGASDVLSALTGAADARLDSQADAYARLRAIEQNAGTEIETTLAPRAAALAARLPGVAATADQLARQYAATALDARRCAGRGPRSVPWPVRRAGRRDPQAPGRGRGAAGHRHRHRRSARPGDPRAGSGRGRGCRDCGYAGRATGSKHHFVAGGIGITPFLAMVQVAALWTTRADPGRRWRSWPG